MTINLPSSLTLETILRIMTYTGIVVLLVSGVLVVLVVLMAVLDRPHVHDALM
jgi:hypothetical protein